jgi:hypothetical protein
MKTAQKHDTRMEELDEKLDRMEKLLKHLVGSKADEIAGEPPKLMTTPAPISVPKEQPSS